MSAQLDEKQRQQAILITAGFAGLMIIIMFLLKWDFPTIEKIAQDPGIEVELKPRMMVVVAVVTQYRLPVLPVLPLKHLPHLVTRMIPKIWKKMKKVRLLQSQNHLL